MVSKIFPPGIIRGYHLDTIINDAADDKEFYLCFAKDGSMGVYIFSSPNKPNSKGYWSDRIGNEQFDAHKVDEKSLRQLVIEKLQAILPPGAETDLGK